MPPSLESLGIPYYSIFWNPERSLGPHLIPSDSVKSLSGPEDGPCNLLQQSLMFLLKAFLVSLSIPVWDPQGSK